MLTFGDGSSHFHSILNDAMKRLKKCCLWQSCVDSKIGAEMSWMLNDELPNFLATVKEKWGKGIT